MKDRERLEKRAGGGAAGVDRLLGRPQPHSLFLQQSDDCGEFAIERAKRSMRVTTRVSPSRIKSIRVCSSARPLRVVPERVSARMISHPAPRPPTRRVLAHDGLVTYERCSGAIRVMNQSTITSERLSRLRALRLALPEASEKETWGDPTWRVRENDRRKGECGGWRDQ